MAPKIALALAACVGVALSAKPQINVDDFKCMFGGHQTDYQLQQHWAAFQKNLEKFGITDRLEIAAFMGHIAHESAHLTRMKEYCADSAVSCPFNGYTSYPNNQPWCELPMPSGKMYFGRGPLQLTWHCNYDVAGKRLGLDLVNNPDLVSDDLNVAHATAMLFWTTPRQGFLDKSVETLGALARSGYFNLTTDRINGYLECGSFDKQAQRVEFYQQARQCLGLPREYLNPVLYCGNTTVPDFAKINGTCLPYKVQPADSFCELAAKHNVSGCCVIPNNTIIDQSTLTDVGKALHVDQEVYICPTQPGERICIAPDIGTEGISMLSSHNITDLVSEVKEDFDLQARFKYGWATGYEAVISLTFKKSATDAANWQVTLALDGGRLLQVFMADMVSYSPPVIRNSRLTALKQATTVTFNVAVAGRFSRDAIRIASYSLTNITSPLEKVDDKSVFIQIPNAANQISDLDPPQSSVVRFGILYATVGLLAFGLIASIMIVIARVRQIKAEETARLIDQTELASSVEMGPKGKADIGTTSNVGGSINLA